MKRFIESRTRQFGFDDAGVMMNTDINRLLQIARNLRIPDGSDEVQRATIAETIGLRFKN